MGNTAGHRFGIRSERYENLIEIRAIKHTDAIEQLTNLFVLVFKFKTPPDRLTESWKWKYLQHPLSACLPEVVVALDGAKIVGARPFMLNELWLGNEKILSAQHCDTMVHPDYRRLGIFNRMGKFASGYLAGHGCTLSYGFPGPMSRKGFASQGYQRMMDIDILLRPVNPLAGISFKLKSKQADNLVNGYQTEVSRVYKGELGVLDSFRKPGVIDMVRSEANLRWRFDSCPHNRYSYILAKQAGSLAGYSVISKQRQRGGISAGLITDFLIKKDDVTCFEALITRAMQEFARASCPIAVTWAFSDSELQQILTRKFHFMSSLRLPYNMFLGPGYMDVLLINENVPGAMDIYNCNKWRVTYTYANFA